MVSQYRARRVIGIAAAVGTTLQCSVGMSLQLVDALRAGPEGLSLSLFAMGGAAMFLWSAWAWLKEDSVEWVAFVPNAIGTVGSAAICFVIVFYRPEMPPGDGTTAGPVIAHNHGTLADSERTP